MEMFGKRTCLIIILNFCTDGKEIGFYSTRTLSPNFLCPLDCLYQQFFLYMDNVSHITMLNNAPELAEVTKSRRHMVAASSPLRNDRVAPF